MMVTIREVEALIAESSPAEKAQLLRAVVSDLGVAFPGITSIPGVNGGEPSIVRTRIAVWTLVQARHLGASEDDLLRIYLSLYAEDLVNAWAYYRANRDEIETQIAENEAA